MKINVESMTLKTVTRHSAQDYGALQAKFQLCLLRWREEINKILPPFIIRVVVTETVLHNEDAECVPDDYPVLLVEIQIIHQKKWWVMKRLPYILVIDKNNEYFAEDGKFHSVLFISENAHGWIASMLKF